MKYMDLKTAIAETEKQHGIHSLDFVSREILHFIASANLLNKKVRVTDIHNENLFGSAPTIYSRLNRLVASGWIERKEDDNDGRTILLQITSRTRDRFKKMSKALEGH